MLSEAYAQRLFFLDAAWILKDLTDVGTKDKLNLFGIK